MSIKLLKLEFKSKAIKISLKNIAPFLFTSYKNNTKKIHIKILQTKILVLEKLNKID